MHAASISEPGHDVDGFDVDDSKGPALSRARAPFFEPVFEELLAHTSTPGG